MEVSLDVVTLHEMMQIGLAWAGLIRLLSTISSGHSGLTDNEPDMVQVSRTDPQRSQRVALAQF